MCRNALTLAGLFLCVLLAGPRISAHGPQAARASRSLADVRTLLETNRLDEAERSLEGRLRQALRALPR